MSDIRGLFDGNQSHFDSSAVPTTELELPSVSSCLSLTEEDNSQANTVEDILRSLQQSQHHNYASQS
jgi:hypothetical protein